MKCPTCRDGDLVVAYIDDSYEFTRDHQVFKVTARNVPVEQCQQCGEQASGPKAALVRHIATCEALGFYTPSDIIALRANLGLSQDGLGKLLGVSMGTVCKWERGRLLQSKSHDFMLYLLARSQETRNLLTIRAQEDRSTK